MKIHIFNAVLSILLAILFGWLFTLASPDSGSGARVILFILTVGSAAVSITSAIAAFTGGEGESINRNKENTMSHWTDYPDLIEAIEKDGHIGNVPLTKLDPIPLHILDPLPIEEVNRTKAPTWVPTSTLKPGHWIPGWGDFFYIMRNEVAMPLSKGHRPILVEEVTKLEDGCWYITGYANGEAFFGDYHHDTIAIYTKEKKNIMPDWTPTYDDRFGEISGLADEIFEEMMNNNEAWEERTTPCNCHDPLPRETGWSPGEEGPCPHDNCTNTPWCGEEDAMDDYNYEYEGQDDLNEMMIPETMECDWCLRRLYKKDIVEVGPTYHEPNGESHTVAVLAMCKDREDCEREMARHRAEMERMADRRPPTDDEIPF